MNTEKLTTPIGDFEFVLGGYPTKETTTKLFDALDFQRACKAYLDFMPAMSLQALLDSNERDLGIKESSSHVSSFTYKKKLVRVPYRPLSQGCTLLTGERDKNAPFSNHLRGNELLDIPVDSFLTSLRFEQRGKLDQLGVDISSID